MQEDPKPKIENYTLEGIQDATKRLKEWQKKRDDAKFEARQQKKDAPRIKLTSEFSRKTPAASDATKVQPSNAKIMYTTIRRTPETKVSSKSITKSKQIPTVKKTALPANPGTIGLKMDSKPRTTGTGTVIKKTMPRKARGY